jgi:hypothetical protein
MTGNAGRPLPTWVESQFTTQQTAYQLQPNFAFSNVRKWQGGATTTATTTMATIGTMAYTGASPTAPTTPTPTTTNNKTLAIRSVISTGATAGALAYIRSNQLQVTTGSNGGFFAVFRFGLAALQTGQRVFAGITDVAANPTNVDPTTNTTPGKVGLAINASTGNWNIVTNITGTAPTVTGLGANYPVNTTDLLQLTLYCPGTTATEGAYIYYEVANLTTGTTTGAQSITTNLPAANTFLAPSIWITNNATAAAATMDVCSCYLESRW